MRQSLAGADEVAIVRSPADTRLEADPLTVDLYSFGGWLPLPVQLADPAETASAVRRGVEALARRTVHGDWTRPGWNDVRDSLLLERFSVDPRPQRRSIARRRHAELLGELTGGYSGSPAG